MLLRPAQLGLLVGFVREGARSISERRRLTRAEAELLQAVELYAYDVRFGNELVGRQRNPGPPGSWLTTEEAARRLSVTPMHVRRLARSGALVGQRHGHAWLIDADSVSTYRSAA